MEPFPTAVGINPHFGDAPIAQIDNDVAVPNQVVPASWGRVKNQLK